MWDGNGVLLLHNQWSNGTYQSAGVDLTTTVGASSVGSVAPVVGHEAYDASLGRVVHWLDVRGGGAVPPGQQLTTVSRTGVRCSVWAVQPTWWS